MLDLIGYDLTEPRNHQHLRSGIRACGSESHNLAYAPWFVETTMTPPDVLRTLVLNLGRRPKDRLLVMNLPEGTAGSAWNRRRETVRWLLHHGLDLRGRNRSGVLGIAYTLHGATSSDYYRLARHIATRFPDYTKPLNALWFVATEESPRTVCRHLAAHLPDPRHDELLVLEVPSGRIGESQLPAEELTWFDEHGVTLH